MPHTQVKRIIYINNGVSCSEEDLPNYLHDLNAMHEAEEKLSDDEHAEFRYQIDKITHPPSCRKQTSATAAQRDEALCRTLWPEKWKD